MKLPFFAVLALLCCVMPASARPRDDVMSGAFRCAGIGNSRQWLDCYYGAAQPQRAQLRLPAAPEAQQHLVAVPPAGGAVEDADTRDAVMAGAFRCKAASDDRGWLDCYYAAAEPMRARLGLAPTPQSGHEPAVEQFGLPAPPPPERTTDRITARMTAYSFDTSHIFTVTLDNGQVWHQISGDTTFAHWDKPARTYLVTITHGAFHSVNMQVKGSAGLYKIVRIR